METLHFDVYTSLRTLILAAESMTLQQLLNHILLISDEHLEKYEELIRERLVSDQINPSNPRYDYGL